MIVPMKKVLLVVQAKDADATISTLRSQGVLHVEHSQPPKGKDIVSLQDDITTVAKALEILSEPDFAAKNAAQNHKEAGDWKLIAGHIIESHKRLNQLQEYFQRLKNMIGQWEPWGDFDPGAIVALNNKNIFIRFYQLPANELKLFPAEVLVKVISKAKGLVNCLAICEGKPGIPFKEIQLPKMGLRKMQGRLSEDARVIDSIKENIAKHKGYSRYLLNIKRQLQKELRFHEVLRGMGVSEGLVYLTGYIPFDTSQQLLALAKSKQWGVLIDEPAEDDRVPTLIRNPRWVSIIKPAFRLIEIVPGYHELDISLWFLLFFSVFFGMLIGDAGYGLVYFALTFFAQKKWGKKLADKSVFVLFYLLSSCAIIWGVLSATFFGQEWLPQHIQPLLPALRSDKSVQSFCFLLGASHLSIAHLWRLILKFPTLSFLADLGWIAVLWGAFFLARLLILGDNFPQFAKWFFIIGPLLVVFFSSPRRNILKGIGNGLGSLLLNIAGAFTDIVSYIRLFAVGLATVAVADAFNKMAMGVGFNSFFQGLLTAFILLIGHLLNVILGPLAILVHGVRLNVLEFCNHLDIKWSGFSYTPLKEEA